MEKLKILWQSKVISKQVFIVCKDIFVNLKHWDHNDKARFLVHLAMALNRIENNEKVDALASDIIKQLKHHTSLMKAEKYLQKILLPFPNQIPKNEKWFLMMHIINHLEREKSNMKVVVGGQLKKEEIKNLILKHKPNAIIKIMTDMNAALAVQNGEYDFYFGACDTGGGGALAMAIALLGIDKAQTIATISSCKSVAEIKAMLQHGVVAFGFVESSIKQSIERIIQAMEDN